MAELSPRPESRLVAFRPIATFRPAPPGRAKIFDFDRPAVEEPDALVTSDRASDQL